MMAEATLENAICETCGAGVRENTLFCYNCGNKFGEAATGTNGTEPVVASDEAKSALDDLAARFKNDGAQTDDRLALAADARKKARIVPRKQKEVIWEAEDERSGLLLFFVSLIILMMVAVIVFLTVYWK